MIILTKVYYYNCKFYSLSLVFYSISVNVPVNTQDKWDSHITTVLLFHENHCFLWGHWRCDHSMVIAKAWLPWQPTQSNACILDISSNRCCADLSRFLETQICQNTKNKAVRLMQKVFHSVLEKSQNRVVVLYGFTRCIQNIPPKMNNMKRGANSFRIK